MASCGEKEQDLPIKDLKRGRWNLRSLREGNEALIFALVCNPLKKSRDPATAQLLRGSITLHKYRSRMVRCACQL